MATITASTTVGVYICEEENGQIAGNTPGGIDIGNLTDGDTYVYCNVVHSFNHRINFMFTDAFKGHKTQGSYAAGGTGQTTGYQESGFINMVLEMTEANLFKWQEIAKRGNRAADAAVSKYLIKQKAANSFRAFPNRALASKYYTEVIILDVNAVEVNGKVDNQQVTVTLQEAQQA